MFEDVKHQVAVANRILSEVGFASGVLTSLGHISMRVPENPNRFIVKGRGYEIDALPLMKPSDMIVCDLDGNKIEAPPGGMQCFEVKMHSCMYRDHPEVQAVCHVHPRFTVMMSVLQARLVPMCQEGAQIVRRPLPVWEHFRIVTTDEDGTGVSRLLGDACAILLRGHGACTAGNNLEQAFMTMYNLEEQARMNWYAYCAAGADHPGIPEELLNETNPARTELPHFKESETVIGRGPRAGGVWGYYTDMIGKRLKAEGL
jgi:ribulose-5-phosphate 4-epimerase/fuculose-1-phosphate aldolase